MRRKARIAVVVIAVLSLGGCSLFDSDEEEAAAADQVISSEIYAPVEVVRKIEIGRTRSGFAITAHGTAPGLGFSTPELRPRRQGRPGPDGFLDFDFVARAPDPGFNLGLGTESARAVRADLQVSAGDLRGAVGIRIHGVSGGLQMPF